MRINGISNVNFKKTYLAFNENADYEVKKKMKEVAPLLQKMESKRNLKYDTYLTSFDNGIRVTLVQGHLGLREKTAKLKEEELLDPHNETLLSKMNHLYDKLSTPQSAFSRI